MESSKAKYKIGTKVKYKFISKSSLKGPTQYGVIKGSYYNYILYTVYYTIMRDDGTTVDVPENLIIKVIK
jgi:hypothetical protein